MKSFGDLARKTPLFWCLSLLLLSAAFHPALGISSSWTIAATQFAFLPLLLWLGFGCFPTLPWALPAYAIALELFLALPLHLVLLYLPLVVNTLLNFDSTNDIQNTWSSYLGVFREEFTKIVPVLILYKRLVSSSNLKGALAVGFFSGLTFGCFESFVTSNNYSFSEIENVTRGMWILFVRTLFFPVIVHALLTAIAAYIVVYFGQKYSLLVGCILALFSTSALHIAVNKLPPYRVLLGFVFIAVFSTLHYLSNNVDSNSPENP